ncbi:hypothetical protein HDF09_002255 [Edaphobacter lichenicola]|uniref:Uncharacterized protein n=1 Tax=Tunturiibacter empetritectus TaxID=3069691 RepID=A0A7W8IJI7_9BACT|nr:hypothetical protein [Edaphobacter lichenicola]
MRVYRYQSGAQLSSSVEVAENPVFGAPRIAIEIATAGISRMGKNKPKGFPGALQLLVPKAEPEGTKRGATMPRGRGFRPTEPKPPGGGVLEPEGTKRGATMPRGRGFRPTEPKPPGGGVLEPEGTKRGATMPRGRGFRPTEPKPPGGGVVEPEGTNRGSAMPRGLPKPRAT